MKRIFTILVISILGSGFSTRCLAQQIDPALTAAVTTQTMTLELLHKKRKSTQEKIIAAETAITLAMDRVHNVENKMLEYLSNAQAAMSNLYQIKRAAELVGVEIPKNLKLVATSIPSNLQGTAVTAVVTNEIKDVYTQMSSLYPFMAQLVTSGSYNVTNSEGEKEAHKVNLLNSAERYYVANEIVSRLEKINIDLFILAWEIRTYSWRNLWLKLDPSGWATIMSGKNQVEFLISRWKGL